MDFLVSKLHVVFHPCGPLSCWVHHCFRRVSKREPAFFFTEFKQLAKVQNRVNSLIITDGLAFSVGPRFHFEADDAHMMWIV